MNLIRGRTRGAPLSAFRVLYQGPQEVLRSSEGRGLDSRGRRRLFRTGRNESHGKDSPRFSLADSRPRDLPGGGTPRRAHAGFHPGPDSKHACAGLAGSRLLRQERSLLQRRLRRELSSWYTERWAEVRADIPAAGPSRSKTITCFPSASSSYAVVSPAMPAPTTQTSA